MTKQDEKIRKLSMSNTKKEMLDAYNAILKKLQEKEEGKLSPGEIKEQKRSKEILKDVDSLASEGVIKSISELKMEMGNLLTRISDKLEEEVNRYIKVKEAIAIKEKEMGEIYEIEKNAQTLTALIEAQSQKRDEFEREMALAREEWEREKKLREAERKEQEEMEQKRRQRMKEEFEYSFNRQKEMEKDKFEDEKAKLAAELRLKKESAEKELAEREAKIAAREEEFNDLQNKVNSFPKEMETAVSKAVKEAVDKCNMERKNAEELQKRIFEGERKLLNSKIENLEKRVQEQNDQILRLSKQLDEAYQKIQNIAVKSIAERTSTEERKQE